jgi:SOS-response transcriptional repressor LexA
MAKRGLNANMLAARMGVRHSTIRRWMRNERQMSVEYIPELATALGVNVDLILEQLQVRPLQVPPSVYDLAERLDRLSASIRIMDGAPKGGRDVSVPLIGRVPADTVRWTNIEGGQTVVDVPGDWLRGARHPFAVEVSGNCLQSLKILDGDIVICDRRDGEEPPQGKVSLVRIGNEITFKRWFRVSPQEVELRDGDGAVVYRLTGQDDYEVVGIALRRLGDFE